MADISTGLPLKAERLRLASGRVTALVVLSIAVLSIPLRNAGLNGDTSWLLTVNEAMLSGQQLYQDIVEVNPPVPVLLTMPAVLLGRVLGFPSEAGVHMLTYASALAGLLLAGMILRRSSQRLAMLVSGAVLLFLLPGNVYAERDYVAAALAMPMVAVLARLAADGTLASLRLRVIATVLAGLVLAVKPVFAAPGLLAVIAAAACMRPPARRMSALLHSGLMPAGLIGVVLTAASLAVYPYLGSRSHELMQAFYMYVNGIGLERLYRETALPAALVAFAFVGTLAAWQLRRGEKNETASRATWLGLAAESVVFTAAAAGFLLAYLLQRKGFPYHIFPAVLYISMALSAEAVRYVQLREQRGLAAGQQSHSCAVAQRIAGACRNCLPRSHA